MRSFVAFMKKECIEMIRTYKVLIMGAVFLLFGIMNPLTAKILPELMGSLLPEGITITIAEPTAMDSWMQFFKNIPQIGLIVMVVVFSGMMANEFAKGTLVNLLTKGLSRTTVILAKFVVSFLLWTASYVLAFGVTYGYTVFFWQDKPSHLIFSVFCLWLFGDLLLAITLLGGVLFRSHYGGLLFTGGVVVAMFLLNLVPKLQEYNPLLLASSNMALLASEKTPAEFVVAIAITIGLMAISLIGAIMVFRKKQI